MQVYGEPAVGWPAQPVVPRRPARRWPWIAFLALAFALTLGVGALLGTTILPTAHAANLAGSGPNVAGGGANANQAFAAGPGANGQCGVLTVSSVNGQTIVAKASDGSSVTIHTSASTQYTRSGQTVAASAVTAGVTIHVDGTHNGDGSINATHIDIS
ncbi:MAG: DUF5666 domain-containing protein [Ktedonobacterales bacterium]